MRKRLFYLAKCVHCINLTYSLDCEKPCREKGKYIHTEQWALHQMKTWIENLSLKSLLSVCKCPYLHKLEYGLGKYLLNISIFSMVSNTIEIRPRNNNIFLSSEQYYFTVADCMYAREKYISSRDKRKLFYNSVSKVFLHILIVKKSTIWKQKNLKPNPKVEQDWKHSFSPLALQKFFKGFN